MTRLSNKRKRTCSESTHDLGRHDLSDNSHASDLAETTTIRTSRNMTETMSTVFYAGAKFSKEALYEKARAICSQFNCRTRITTNKEETHATLECSGNNYKRARKEESNSEKHPMQDDREQCPFYIFAHVEKNNEELWGVCHANLEHNHAFIDESIMIGCKQIPLEDFDFACKMIRRDFEPKLVLQLMKDKGIQHDLTTSDINDIYQRFCHDAYLDIPKFISQLKQAGYHVRTKHSDGKIHSFFFMHEHESQELRRFPESIIVDTTYKLKDPESVLLTVVISGSLGSEFRPTKLTTIQVAGCWMTDETTESYEWALKQLRDITWPDETDLSRLPNNFVTDKKPALMEAIKLIFPEANHILCYVHIASNFVRRFNKHIRKLDKANQCVQKKEFKAIVDKIALGSKTEKELLDAKLEYDTFVSQENLCTDKGKEMKAHLERMMDFRHQWVGCYVNTYKHFGNRTANRAKSINSSLKRHSHSYPDSLALVTERICRWIEEKEHYRRQQMYSEVLTEITFHVGAECDVNEKMKELKRKITGYAYHHICLEYIEYMKSKANPDPTTTDECACILPKVYCLPCRHHMKKYDGPIPLSAVHKRWHVFFVKQRDITIDKVIEARHEKNKMPEAPSKS